MNTTGRLKDKVLWMYIRSLKSYRTALVLSYLSVVLINYTIIMIIQIQMMTRFQVLELKTISYQSHISNSFGHTISTLNWVMITRL